MHRNSCRYILQFHEENTRICHIQIRASTDPLSNPRLCYGLLLPITNAGCALVLFINSEMGGREAPAVGRSLFTGCAVLGLASFFLPKVTVPLPVPSPSAPRSLVAPTVAGLSISASAGPMLHGASLTPAAGVLARITSSSDDGVLLLVPALAAVCSLKGAATVLPWLLPGRCSEARGLGRSNICG
eukprot:TRINITY_DN14561_c0_g1_i3.p2 TRINITY_DN14561_c0_g1~~TRINITY_DN14561_c0_g1_i3.p2  ORF type:complete len:186 (+),score=10.82 TRINITY_DN14561_c0_g1_i3:307-864(+)